MFIVVAVAAVASIAAFATLAMSSSSRRESQLESDFSQTNSSLRSAFDWAAESLQADHLWRTTYASNNSADTAVAISIGDSTFKWYLLDPADNDISDEPSDPVKVVAIGEKGSCSRQASGILLPAGNPLDVLRSPIHVTGNLTLTDSVVFANGPLSCDGTIYGNSHSIFGSIECQNSTSIERVYRSSFTYTSPKTMPSKFVFGVYESIATKVDYDQLATANHFENQIISNASSPGPGTMLNANGVYLIDVPASTTFKIKNTKITGTLLIRLTGANSKLEIADGVDWNPQRNDFPALIVQSETDSGNTVQISSQGTFLNPLNGELKSARLNGVFHVIRPADATSTTLLTATNVFRGSFLVDGDVQLEDASLFAANPDLITEPPIGYQTARGPTRLAENAQFEAGLSPWYPLKSNYRGGGTRIESVTRSDDGTRYVRVCGRKTSSAGIAQDVTAIIENGKSYSGSVRARLAESSEVLNVALEIVDDSGSQTVSLLSKSMTTSWSTEAFNFTVNWTGELKSAKLLVYTDNQTQDFYLDRIEIPVSGTSFRTDLDFIPAAIQLE